MQTPEEKMKDIGRADDMPPGCPVNDDASGVENMLANDDAKRGGLLAVLIVVTIVAFCFGCACGSIVTQWRATHSANSVSKYLPKNK